MTEDKYRNLEAILQRQLETGRRFFGGMRLEPSGDGEYLLRIGGAAGKNLALLMAFERELPRPEGVASVFVKESPLCLWLEFLAEGLRGNPPEEPARALLWGRIEALEGEERKKAEEAFKLIPWAEENPEKANG